MKSLVSCKPTLHLSDFIFSSIEPFLCYVYKYSNYRLNTVAFVSGVSPPCLVDKKMTTRGSSTGWGQTAPPTGAQRSAVMNKGRAWSQDRTVTCVVIGNWTQIKQSTWCRQENLVEQDLFPGMKTKMLQEVKEKPQKVSVSHHKNCPRAEIHWASDSSPRPMQRAGRDWVGSLGWGLTCWSGRINNRKSAPPHPPKKHHCPRLRRWVKPAQDFATWSLQLQRMWWAVIQDLPSGPVPLPVHHTPSSMWT